VKTYNAAILIVVALACGCYQVEDGTQVGDVCTYECTTSTWWDTAPAGCSSSVRGWMQCMQGLTCTQAEEAGAGEPFTEDAYPCKAEEEEATWLGCGGTSILPWR
jgi:hypothetical protein